MTRRRPIADRRATVWDVAHRAGVSHTTVFLALRGSPRIGVERAAAIRAIADRLGYAPRAAAQLLRSPRTGWIGLLLEGASPEAIAESGFTSPLLAHFLALTQARERRQLVEFFAAPARGRFVPPRMLAGGLVDGVVLGGLVDARLRTWLARQRVHPWVSIGEDAPYAVQDDAARAVEIAIDALAARGHRRFALSVGPGRFATHAVKARAFRAALAARGLAIDPGCLRCVDADAAAPDPGDAAWAAELLGRRRRPTAFLCHGHGGRTVAYVAATLGLRVPRDLSIVAFLQGIEAEHAAPALATASADDASIVRTAMDLLEALLRGERPPRGTRLIAPRFAPRETIGAAPRVTSKR